MSNDWSVPSPAISTASERSSVRQFMDWRWIWSKVKLERPMEGVKVCPVGRDDPRGSIVRGAGGDRWVREGIHRPDVLGAAKFGCSPPHTPVSLSLVEWSPTAQAPVFDRPHLAATAHVEAFDVRPHAVHLHAAVRSFDRPGRHPVFGLFSQRYGDEFVVVRQSRRPRTGRYHRV